MDNTIWEVKFVRPERFNFNNSNVLNDQILVVWLITNKSKFRCIHASIRYTQHLRNK